MLEIKTTNKIESESTNVIETNNVLTIPQKKSQNKKQIPKKIKQLVWNKWIGEEKGIGECKCCEITKISQIDFSCGHIISEFNGGETTLENLLPICSLCNCSMGTTNLNIFKKTHGLGKLSEKNKYAHITTIKNGYSCKDCNYFTEKISHFKKHLDTTKHISNLKNITQNDTINQSDIKKYKKRMYSCKNCDSDFLSKTTIWRHFQTCKIIPHI